MQRKEEYTSMVLSWSSLHSSPFTGLIRLSSSHPTLMANTQALLGITSFCMPLKIQGFYNRGGHESVLSVVKALERARRKTLRGITMSQAKDYKGLVSWEER